MNKKQKRGHNKNIQLIKELDREILILPLSIPPLCEAVEWGIFMYNCCRLLKKSQRFVIVSKENNIFKRKGWNEHGFITGMA